MADASEGGQPTSGRAGMKWDSDHYTIFVPDTKLAETRVLMNKVLARTQAERDGRVRRVAKLARLVDRLYMYVLRLEGAYVGFRAPIKIVETERETYGRAAWGYLTGVTDIPGQIRVEFLNAIVMVCVSSPRVLITRHKVGFEPNNTYELSQTCRRTSDRRRRKQLKTSTGGVHVTRLRKAGRPARVLLTEVLRVIDKLSEAPYDNSMPYPMWARRTADQENRSTTYHISFPPTGTPYRFREQEVLRRISESSREFTEVLRREVGNLDDVVASVDRLLARGYIRQSLNDNDNTLFSLTLSGLLALEKLQEEDRHAQEVVSPPVPD